MEIAHPLEVDELQSSVVNDLPHSEWEEVFIANFHWKYEQITWLQNIGGRDRDWVLL